MKRVLKSRLADMEECKHPDMPGGEAFSLGYGMAIYKAAAEYLENHRHELVGAALRNEVSAGNDTSGEPAAEELAT